MGAIHESDERFPPPLCHPGTRSVVVSQIIAWYLEETGEMKGIMWVHAPAGYGKTAIAGTVKEKLDAMELDFESPVGATFFFWRTSPERNSPARLIITLAYQLAQSIPELRPHVDAAIKFRPGIVKLSLKLQVKELIVKPFQSLPDINTMPNRLVIIDGIDECINSDQESRVEKKYAEDQEAVQIRVLDLIHDIQSHHLPLSFLVLSRPESWIKRHLESEPFRTVVKPLDLYEVGDHMNDVKQFVRTELSRIATSFNLKGADEEWSLESQLVEKSEGLMVYAATVLRQIDDPYGDPRQLLEDILTNTYTPGSTPYSRPLSSLHELYRQIMRSCPERNQTQMFEVLEDILAFEDVIFEDRRVHAVLDILDRLSGRYPGSGMRALRPLHAVLRIENEEELIDQIFIHSSFEEFLSIPDISSGLSVIRRNGQERLLSKIIDSLGRIRTNMACWDLDDDDTRFALKNWLRLWSQANEVLFLESQAHLQMSQKILVLDLTACFMQSYISLQASLLADLSFNSRRFRFFTGSASSTMLPPTRDKITSYTQFSLEAAFIALLQSTNLPQLSSDAIKCIASDCGDYLRRVENWQKNKVVEALRNPGPMGTDLLKAVLEETPWELDRHIYESMVRDRNPILETEQNPFCGFEVLWPTETDSESNSGSTPISPYSSVGEYDV
jgi:hypothetical protein